MMLESSPVAAGRMGPAPLHTIFMSVMDSPRHWSGERLSVCLAFVGLLALRLPFLPPSLDGLDSVNFDLGTHDFDPLAHRPHPPGYPFFIVAAKMTHAVIEEHGTALAAVSAVFGAALVWPLWALIRALSLPGAGLLATVLVLFNPLVWFSSVRPMSDTMGLSAVVAAQALLVGGLLQSHDGSRAFRARRLWISGALVAGLALGARVQAIVLVGPLLCYGWWRWRGTRVATTIAFAVGVALWLVPVAVLSGGPIVLARGFIELVMDAVPVEPLLSDVTVDRARWAAHDVFMAPWGSPWMAIPIVSLAALGWLTLTWHDRGRLLLITLLFVPYTVYHYLLQMTETVRYAIPIVPFIAVLAAEPLVRWRARIGLPIPMAAATALAAAAVITVPALLAYRSSPSPVSQAIAHIRSLAGDGKGPLVSGHFVFDRYLDEIKADIRVIEPVPRTEWRRLAEYWKGGGREPILFLRDARRTSLALVGRRSQTPLAEWTWPASVQPFLKGSRPAWIELVRIEPPRWFAESGFFLTGEAGPVERVAREPHRFYIDAAQEPEAVLVSGKVLGAEAADLTLRVGERAIDRWVVRGQFTARADLHDVAGLGYLPVTLEATAPVLLTELLVQPADRGTVHPSTGFYLPERDEHGHLFRWMGPEATAVIAKKGQRLRLRLQGSVPVDYFRFPVTLTISLDDRPLGSLEIASRDFVFAQDLPPDSSNVQSTLKFTVSQQFVPNEIERNGDLRRLSLRVYELDLEPVTTPAPGAQ